MRLRTIVPLIITTTALGLSEAQEKEPLKVETGIVDTSKMSLEERRAHLYLRELRRPRDKQAKVAQTQGEADEFITAQMDEVIGRERRVLALLQKAQIWMEVDPDHPDAKQVFAELERLVPAFVSESERLRRTFELNKELLSSNALIQFTADIKVRTEKLNDIKRGIRQFAAMRE